MNEKIYLEHLYVNEMEHYRYHYGLKVLPKSAVLYKNIDSAF